MASSGAHSMALGSAIIYFHGTNAWEPPIYPVRVVAISDLSPAAPATTLLEQNVCEVKLGANSYPGIILWIQEDMNCLEMRAAWMPTFAHEATFAEKGRRIATQLNIPAKSEPNAELKPPKRHVVESKSRVDHLNGGSHSDLEKSAREAERKRDGTFKKKISGRESETPTQQSSVTKRRHQPTPSPLSRGEEPARSKSVASKTPNPYIKPNFLPSNFRNANSIKRPVGRPSSTVSQLTVKTSLPVPSDKTSDDDTDSITSEEILPSHFRKRPASEYRREDDSPAKQRVRKDSPARCSSVPPKRKMALADMTVWVKKHFRPDCRFEVQGLAANKMFQRALQAGNFMTYTERGRSSLLGSIFTANFPGYIGNLSKTYVNRRVFRGVALTDAGIQLAKAELGKSEEDIVWPLEMDFANESTAPKYETILDSQ